jgi:hypothetical protein
VSAIHIDVITEINKASAAAGAAQLEALFGEAGRKAAEAFAANADLSMTSAGRRVIRLRPVSGPRFDAQFGKSLPGVEKLEKLMGGWVAMKLAARRGALAGRAAGVAFEAAFAGAIGAGAGLLAIGEQFEEINRQATLSTGATGQALDGLKQHASQMVGGSPSRPVRVAVMPGSSRSRKRSSSAAPS